MEPVKNSARRGGGGSVASFAEFAPRMTHSPTVETPLVYAGEDAPWWRSEDARRALNVLAAAVLLIILSPLMLVLAALVKLTSPGPVFYRQLRVGIDRRRGNQLSGNWRRKTDHGGRLFEIYKFRTMHVGSDRVGQVWASQNDPRITAIGGILRKYRLDELPQLINVLRGDMNLVGPRPEQPTIFQELRVQIDRYQHRQYVLPGITGWAQVNQHYDSCIDDVRNKVQLDLEYIERRSAAEDLRIMLRTVPVMVFQKGAW